ncbi:MAG: glycosyltransferase family 4 protein [Nitrospirota bacterium]
MKVLQINTSDINGGAAIAAFRLHKGLNQIGAECRMLVKEKASKADTVLCISPENTNNTSDKAFFLNEVIQAHYINAHRTDISNTLFSLPYPGYDLSQLSVVQDADIINLHWVAYYQSPLTLQKLFALGKPVVWTLHDQWAFTGGCHYSAGCNKYQEDCTACPQLANDAFELPSSVLKDKMELFKDADLTIVSPSRWLADCAGKSRLFRDIRIEVIPNPLDTDVFSPMNKSEAKANLNISAESITILFGAENNNETRKGFKHLAEAIKRCLSSDTIQELINKNNLNILCFGYPSAELKEIGMPTVSLGYLNNTSQIRNAYAAADIFVLPSLEDNLPNTLTESSSCGVPAVAFDVGGIPDVLTHGETGLLVEAGNTRQMAEAIKSLIINHSQRTSMGEPARKLILEKCSVKARSNDYYSLFRELQKGRTSFSPPHKTPDTTKNIESRSVGLHSHLNTDFGSNFKTIYDAVLFKALKEFAVMSQNKLLEVEKENMQKNSLINEHIRILNSIRKRFLYRLSERLTNLQAKIQSIIKSIF